MSIINYFGLDISASDIPKRFCTVVYLWGCNFFCDFCHNKACADISTKININTKDLAEKILQNQLATSISITGGEPLMQFEAVNTLIDFLKAKLPDFFISLDTNGLLSEKVSRILPKLNRIALDFKNSPEKYEETIRTKIIFDNIKKTIEFINQQPKIEFEIRTTMAFPLVTLYDIEKIIEQLKILNFKGTYVITQYRWSEGVGDEFKDKFSAVERPKIIDFIQNLEIPFQVAIRTIDRGYEVI